jgi:hypothetical protein
MFVVKIIWEAWEDMKPKLKLRGNSLRLRLTFNEHILWWSLVVLYNDKPLVDSSWFLTNSMLKRGVQKITDLFDR